MTAKDFAEKYPMPKNNWEIYTLMEAFADQKVAEEWDRNRKLSKLLMVAKCPNCDGGGTIVTSTDNEGNADEIEPCQWCYEKRKNLSLIKTKSK